MEPMEAALLFFGILAAFAGVFTFLVVSSEKPKGAKTTKL